MNPLVEPSWVVERIGRPEIVLLDATLPPVGVAPKIDTHARHLEAHIPGAVFFDIEQLSDHNTTLPHMLPSPERFAEQMLALGVGSDGTLIVYEQGDVFSAPRAWWMLRTLGARDVSILNGGLSSWRKLGLPIASGPVSRNPAIFHADLNAEAVTDLRQLQQLLPLRSTNIIDARSAARFTGAAPEPRPNLPSGHMPCSINIPYTELTDGTRMRSPSELSAVFAQHQVDLTRPTITTCGSGVTAAVLALGLEICGASHVSLYDGSWAEYAQVAEIVR